MAEVLDGYEFPKRGRRSSYPWDEWLDGQTRRLVHGEDFNCEPSSMEGQIRKHANERELSVQAHSDETTVTFVARPKAEG